mgnify:FL=1
MDAAVDDAVGLGARTGRGVAFGSDSKPGSEPARMAGVFMDLKAIEEIKTPATNTVINKIKYSDTLFIMFDINIPENRLF